MMMHTLSVLLLVAGLAARAEAGAHAGGPPNAGEMLTRKAGSKATEVSAPTEGTPIWERLHLPRSINAAGLKQVLCGGGDRADFTVAFFSEPGQLVDKLRSLGRAPLWQGLRDAECSKTMVLRVKQNMDIYDFAAEVDKTLRACPGPTTDAKDKSSMALKKLIMTNMREQGMYAYKGTKVAISSENDSSPCKVSVSGKTKGVIREPGFMKR